VGAMGTGTTRSLMVPPLLLAWMMLAWGPYALALDPGLDVSQYAHTAWKVRDGFSKGAISSIAQTPDGYLWLGTEFGLLRFDGVKAVPWQPPAGEQLPSTSISRLLVSRDGTLWIATRKGLASWKDGKLRGYPEVGGWVAAIIEDREGTVWAGIWMGGQGDICAVHNGTVACYGKDGSLGLGVLSLYEDSQGNLWAGSGGGFWQWRPGPPKFHAIPGEGPYAVQSFVQDADGSLLIAAREIRRLSDGKVEARPYLPPYMPSSFGQGSTPFRFLRDRYGALWIGTNGNGLWHVRQGRTDVFNQADGLSGDTVYALFEDREGSLWVATGDGLDRFRDFAIPTWSVREGLSVPPGGAVLAARDGTVWVGARKGLRSLKQGYLTIYRSRSEREPDVVGQHIQEKIDSRLPQGIFGAMFQDHSGRVWVSWRGGIGYFDKDQFHPTKPIGTRFVMSIAEDASGDLWLGAQQDGLLRLHDGRVVQRILWDGLSPNGPSRQLIVDRLRGGLWMGFVKGGIGYFKEGRLRESYSSSDVFGEGSVNDLRIGPRGTLWAATDGGLSRIKDGHVMNLSSKNGLPCDHVHWSIEDDDHFVWLYMSCGLVRIARSELNAWVSDPKQKVQPTIFDASAGVRTVADYAGFSPQVGKAPDGRIWFAGMDGVSVIDPRHLPYNKIPPPVHIEQIIADRKTYNVESARIDEEPASEGGRYRKGRLRLPPLVRDLEIDYTALSLVAPEKVLFRYKLEGLDRDWQEAGNRRQAFYTNLSPRKYRFRVSACNNSGVWNEAGTFLDFSVAPAYYQTLWFRLSCVIAFLALLWALYQLRLRQVAQQFNMRLEERVGERTRIARDLHDTLLQSFQGLLLRFQTVSNLLPSGEPKLKLDEAIDQAAQAITEGRDAVQGLRSSTKVTNDLALAISALSDELGCGETNPNCAEFNVEVEGTPRNLHPILRDEVYRIAGEAVRNAFKHAQAERVEVEIRYDERQLRLRVRDDGKGIDAKLLNQGGRAGHYGLPGMRERAKLMGGKLAVWSEADVGTEVELRIPASRAYETSPARRRSWFAEKFSAKETQMKP
jgi:signal transduction histidine kinase/ligand-binding sensor domain-containing protein